MKKPAKKPDELPQAVEAEQDVLGACLLHPPVVVEVSTVIGAEHFYEQRNGEIFRVISAEYAKNPATDLRIIHRSLKGRDWFEEAGGLKYLAAMTDRVADASNARFYATMVRESFIRRKLVDFADRLNFSARGNGSTADLVERFKREMAELSPVSRERRFKFNTLAEFASLDLRVEYHIPDILAAGPVPTVMSGSFKTLKTSIAVDMAVSLATGSRFLGRYQANECPVGIMSGESGGYALQSVMKRVSEARGIITSGVENLHICTAIPSLSLATDMAELEEVILEKGLKVFMLDPTYMAMRGLRGDEAGNVFQMASMLEPVTALAKRTGCTPILIHHNSRSGTKNNLHEPAELADIAWSGFAEWAGQWLLLARRSRFNPDSNGEHALWLTVGGRDGHATVVGVDVTEGRQNDPEGKRWEIKIDEASSVRREAAENEQKRREDYARLKKEKQLEADVDAVLRAVPEGGASKNTIGDRAHINRTRFKSVFLKLVDDGRLVMTGTEKAANRQTVEVYNIPGRKSATTKELF